MFFLAMASPALLRPVRDQFGVQSGVEQMPWLYSLTLLATMVAVVPFWWLANRMPSRQFVPIVVHACTLLVALFGVGLVAIGDYGWERSPGFGEAFWAAFSAFNVVVPALVWIHAVENFRSDAARRVFGLIAIGGTLGVVAGSWVAGWMTSATELLDGAGQPTGETAGLGLPPWSAAVVSATLLQVLLLAFRGSLRACRQLCDDGLRVAHGGLLEGLRILAQSRRAQGVGIYMMLLGVLATAFYATQVEMVASHIPSSRDQHVWLADVEFWGQSLVLVMQLVCTGRLLQRWPGSVLLISLPFVSIVGLGALWLLPAIDTLHLVQIGRRGAQYSLEKPAREVLYTPMSLATKHKVKFLLDTFAFRLGDLLGAVLALQLSRAALGPGGKTAVTVGVALVWIALGLRLGRRERQPASTS